MAIGEKERFSARPLAWRLAIIVAVVSALLAFAVCVLLISSYIQVRATAPLDSPELLKLREMLANKTDPDEALVEQIRALDLLARKAFFTSQAQLIRGGTLLLGAVIILFVALKLAARWRPVLPVVARAPQAQSFWHERAGARRAVGGAGIFLVSFALFAAFFSKSGVPSLTSADVAPRVAESAVTTSVAEARPEPRPAPLPTFEELKQQWPSFRGAGGYGVARTAGAPIDWDGASLRAIRWKVPVPLPGNSSPVVWNDRLFLTGADDDAREVYCFQVDTGDLLWKAALPDFPGVPDSLPAVTEDTGFAAPTMAVHGDRAFCIFGTGDIACFDFEGELLWGKYLGDPDNHYGHSSSLLALDDLLFVQFDQHTNGRLLALDVATGTERWAVPRKRISWASPICADTGSGFQLILASEEDVDAYDPATGALLWSEACLYGEVGPSPAFGDGLVLVANDNASASALSLKLEEGDTGGRVLWEWDDAMPDVSSPLAADGRFYICTSAGEIACLDAASGELAWLKEFDDGFYASPILVGDSVYVLDMRGTMMIFRTGPKYELIASPKLGETTVATPAFLNNRIYIRTLENLFCIEGRDD